MRISDLAQELKTTEQMILDKLKALKLRAKDGNQELNVAVEAVVRDELAKEGFVSVVKEEPKKPRTRTAKPKAEGKEKAEKPAKGKTTKKTKKDAEGAPVEVAAKVEEPPKKPAKTEKTAAVKETPKKAEPEAAAPAKTPSQPAPVAPPKVQPKEPEPHAPQPAAAPKPPAPKPVFEEVKKPFKKPEPFITVKPLAKKRKRPAEGGHGDDRRGGDRHAAPVFEPTEVSAVPSQLSDLEIPVPIDVKDFANRVNQKTNVVLKKLLMMGIFANINQSLPEEIVRKLAAEFGYNLIVPKTQEEKLIHSHKNVEEDPALLKQRAPVITFMGHVDHGKTSLIDRIRKAKVVDTEHGGITQHIGAYSVQLPKGKITFLDTPGHEAFTAMRARGAHITDIVVLVIAADEGIMPQTKEAIDHARAANVPVVVAMNKIDKKNADPDRVKKQLMEIDLMPEDWGGKTVVVGVSAATGEGIDELLEMILLESELLELKANPDRQASGIVVEAHLSRGRGVLATVIVQNGTLKEGDFVVAGPYYGKLRALFDDHERPIKSAGPSTPVEILGLPEVPEAGEPFYVVADERSARDITMVRQEKLKNERLHAVSKITLDDLFTQIQQGAIKELNVILKADVQGSVEALRDSLAKLATSEVKLKFIHVGVGEVNASDVLLAVASSAIIIAFNVGTDNKAKQELEKTPVDIRQYRIIYDAVNDLKLALEGMLEPTLKKRFLGRIEIRQVFKLSRGIIAGCFVQKGKARNRAKADIVRNGEIVHTSSISSLKRFKDDVREVAEGMECGLTIENYDKVEVGDIVELFEIESIARKL